MLFQSPNCYSRADSVGTYQDEKAKSEETVTTMLITFATQGCGEVHSPESQNYMLKITQRDHLSLDPNRC